MGGPVAGAMEEEEEEEEEDMSLGAGYKSQRPRTLEGYVHREAPMRRVRRLVTTRPIARTSLSQGLSSNRGSERPNAGLTTWTSAGSCAAEVSAQGPL